MAIIPKGQEPANIKKRLALVLLSNRTRPQHQIQEVSYETDPSF